MSTPSFPWRPMSEAPKDGTPFLAKFRDDLTIMVDSKYQPSDWAGYFVVVRINKGCRDPELATPAGWGFDGGFFLDEFEGWAPLPGGDDLRAPVAELERALAAEKKCHLLACKLILERDARLEAMGGRVAELEEALKPFAAEGMTYSPQWEDTDRVATSIYDEDIHDVLDKSMVTVGDLRRAMKLLGANPVSDILSKMMDKTDGKF